MQAAALCICDLKMKSLQTLAALATVRTQPWCVVARHVDELAVALGSTDGMQLVAMLPAHIDAVRFLRRSHPDNIRAGWKTVMHTPVRAWLQLATIGFDVRRGGEDFLCERLMMRDDPVRTHVMCTLLARSTPRNTRVDADRLGQILVYYCMVLSHGNGRWDTVTWIDGRCEVRCIAMISVLLRHGANVHVSGDVYVESMYRLFHLDTDGPIRTLWSMPRARNLALLERASRCLELAYEPDYVASDVGRRLMAALPPHVAWRMQARARDSCWRRSITNAPTHAMYEAWR